MTKEGIYLQFTGPTGWTEFHEGGKVVYHGPKREELLVSGTLVTGEGRIDEMEHWKMVLFQRTVEIVKKTAADPGLKTIRELEPDRISEFDCWTMCSETINGDTLFWQSIIC